MGPRFESVKVHQWPIGQVVKTAASHAVNIGSNPVWVTKNYEVIFTSYPFTIRSSLLLREIVLDIMALRCYNSEAVRSRKAFDIKGGQSHPNRVRVDCHVGPPVPIPNTEVKHMYADDSCRATGRENR